MSSRLHNAREARAHGRTIFIVDDDEEIAELIGIIFSNLLPYHVIVASTGHDALDMARTATPALFLLDYQLPDMNGIQLADQLHNVPELEQVPVLLISANLPLAEMKKRGLSGIQKPFDLDQLIQAIERLLQDDYGKGK